MRVGIFNVKFSPNVGDGLLSECLEAELAAQAPGVTAASMDLAGRTEYGRGGMRNRRTALAVLDMLPAPARRQVVGGLLGRTVDRTLRPAWRERLRQVDAVILGGGNLMADHDLNFPIKIRGALAEVARIGLPVAVYGVGVSDDWSKTAERMFRQALGGVRLVHAATRDTRSNEAWDQRLGDIAPKAALCRDPALLAARHFPAQAVEGDGRPRVALGLTDPLALRYHGRSAVSPSQLSDWFVEVAAAAAARGWRLSAFTNGSPEDRAYLQGLTPRLLAAAPQTEIAPDFERASDLARFVAAQDLIMAHRLHAGIAAYAYAKPHVGFTWDPKLDSFFQSVGREGFIAESGVLAPLDVVAMGDRALIEGVDPVVHARVVAEAAQGVADAYAALASAVGRAA